MALSVLLMVAVAHRLHHTQDGRQLLCLVGHGKAPRHLHLPLVAVPVGVEALERRRLRRVGARRLRVIEVLLLDTHRSTV